MMIEKSKSLFMSILTSAHMRMHWREAENILTVLHFHPCLKSWALLTATNNNNNETLKSVNSDFLEHLLSSNLDYTTQFDVSNLSTWKLVELVELVCQCAHRSCRSNKTSWARKEFLSKWKLFRMKFWTFFFLPISCWERKTL